MRSHNYLTVGAGRWCLGCNTFQRWSGREWKDDSTLIGSAWPHYSATSESCGDQPAKQESML